MEPTSEMPAPDANQEQAHKQFSNLIIPAIPDIQSGDPERIGNKVIEAIALLAFPDVEKLGLAYIYGVIHASAKLESTREKVAALALEAIDQVVDEKLHEDPETLAFLNQNLCWWVQRPDKLKRLADLFLDIVKPFEDYMRTDEGGAK